MDFQLIFVFDLSAPCFLCIRTVRCLKPRKKSKEMSMTLSLGKKQRARVESSPDSSILHFVLVAFLLFSEVTISQASETHFWYFSACLWRKYCWYLLLVLWWFVNSTKERRLHRKKKLCPAVTHCKDAFHQVASKDCHKQYLGNHYFEGMFQTLSKRGGRA